MAIQTNFIAMFYIMLYIQCSKADIYKLYPDIDFHFEYQHDIVYVADHHSTMYIIYIHT